MTCGRGQQTRYRECVDHETDTEIGTHCKEQGQGPATESRDCNQDPCPGIYFLEFQNIKISLNFVKTIYLVYHEQHQNHPQ